MGRSFLFPQGDWSGWDPPKRSARGFPPPPAIVWPGSVAKRIREDPGESPGKMLAFVGEDSEGFRLPMPSWPGLEERSGGILCGPLSRGAGPLPINKSKSDESMRRTEKGSDTDVQD